MFLPGCELIKEFSFRINEEEAVFMFLNGWVYRGQYRNECAHGEGQWLTDCAVFEGLFRDGRFSSGRITFLFHCFHFYFEGSVTADGRFLRGAFYLGQLELSDFSRPNQKEFYLREGTPLMVEHGPELSFLYVGQHRQKKRSGHGFLVDGVYRFQTGLFREDQPDPRWTIETDLSRGVFREQREEKLSFKSSMGTCIFKQRQECRCFSPLLGVKIELNELPSFENLWNAQQPELSGRFCEADGRDKFEFFMEANLLMTCRDNKKLNLDTAWKNLNAANPNIEYFFQNSMEVVKVNSAFIRNFFANSSIPSILKSEKAENEKINGRVSKKPLSEGNFSGIPDFLVKK